MPLQVGEPAPDFNLTDAHGNLVSLRDFRGKRVILYFYPRDNTPDVLRKHVISEMPMINFKLRA
jgi:peroxiredoxin